MREPVHLALFLSGLFIVSAVVWYLASPLFINRTVDEDLPVIGTESAELGGMTAQEMEQLEEEFMAALPPAEAMPTAAVATAAEPVLLRDGEFYGADDFHQGSGTALVYQLADSSFLLRFEDFEVINGPDLHVILAIDDRPYNHAMLGDFLDLGELKGNIGTRTIPSLRTPTWSGTAAW